MKCISEQQANKFRFYSRAFFQHWCLPNGVFRSQLRKKLDRAGEYDPDMISERVDYYNRLGVPFVLSDAAVSLGHISSKKRTAYYYDYREVMRHFSPMVRADVLFGDVRAVAEVPTIVKSRLISDENQNSVLLKLNKVRHFMPIKDATPFELKKNMIVWRGAVWRDWRKDFLRWYIDHPLCDVGQVNEPRDDTPLGWVKPRMSIAEQLKYKFILSVEGNDVATNLKWIAQSNSLCFMKKPTCETWMMEGRLQPGIHYVELKENYEDLPGKIEYYSNNTDEALEIISNFKAYYRQFSDPVLEELLQLLVMKKYLTLSGQIGE